MKEQLRVENNKLYLANCDLIVKTQKLEGENKRLREAIDPLIKMRDLFKRPPLSISLADYVMHINDEIESARKVLGPALQAEETK